MSVPGSESVSESVSAEEWGGYVGMLEDFLAAVRGTRSVSPHCRDGLRALELVVATQLSLAQGVPVELPLEAADARNEEAARP